MDPENVINENPLREFWVDGPRLFRFGVPFRYVSVRSTDGFDCVRSWGGEYVERGYSKTFRNHWSGSR